MKFLIDAQLPPALRRWIEAQGQSALHVMDIGLLAAGDREIAAYAEAHHLILVSKDEDFIYLRLPDRFAFLWLRCGNATNRFLQAWLAPKWGDILGMFAMGERFVEVR
jgi:predicted nuclease of predicted toxin-antitoxin system